MSRAIAFITSATAIAIVVPTGWLVSDFLTVALSPFLPPAVIALWMFVVVLPPIVYATRYVERGITKVIDWVRSAA